MKVYRIKHLPTGLYYRPASQAKITFPGDTYECGGKTYPRPYYVKTNLSKKGKVYSPKPSLKWIGDRIYSHMVPCKSALTRYNEYMIPAPESDWLIEEVSE